MSIGQEINGYCTLFQDQSKFPLESNSRHILIWRKQGYSHHKSSIFEEHGHNGSGIIIRYYAEIATCVGCIVFGIIQQVQEILAQGLLGFLYSLTTSPTKSTFVLSNFLILSCIPCRVLGDREMEDILLVMAIPGSWFYLIFFAGYVIIFQKLVISIKYPFK
ncbi:UNVERIFIED_CONTAM: hypothetical protein NCL1_36164 [Trichonephila clavipes]